MNYQFDWLFVLTFLPNFGTAVIVTVQVFLAALLISTTGAAVMAIASRFKFAPLRGALAFYSWLFRGLPELIVLLFAFLALPQLGLTLPSFWAAVFGLAAINMAYEYEIFRGALNAVPEGQFEASRALGMSATTMYRRIIGPQVLRVALAPYLTFSCTSLKRTSIASSIAVMEIMGYARRMVEALQKPFELMLMAMILYAALSSVLMILEYLGRRHFATSQPVAGGRL